MHVALMGLSKQTAGGKLKINLNTGELKIYRHNAQLPVKTEPGPDNETPTDKTPTCSKAEQATSFSICNGASSNDAQSSLFGDNLTHQELQVTHLVTPPRITAPATVPLHTRSHRPTARSAALEGRDTVPFPDCKATSVMVLYCPGLRGGRPP